MAYLTIKTGPSLREKQNLAAGVYTIGRHPKCEIYLDVSAVSRRHTRLTLEPEGRCYVEDLNSRNGTYLNDELVQGRQQIKVGDELRICDVLLWFHHDEEDRSQSSVHNSHSVTQWLAALPEDSPEAAEQIWNRFVQRVAAFASRRLGELQVRSATQDDIVIEVFSGFFRRAKEGKIRRLADRDDLWRTLACITNDRVIDAWRKKQPAFTESALGVKADGSSYAPLLQVNAGEPSPEFAAEVAEELELLLERLDQRHPDLREVALLHLSGHTPAEISEHLKTPQRTVERRLKWIRETCEERVA